MRTASALSARSPASALFKCGAQRVASRRSRPNKATPRAAYTVGAPISDCTVVVTGANRGIGLEFVTQLLDKGNKVIASCRKPDSDDAGDLRALQAKSEGKLVGAGPLVRDL